MSILPQLERDLSEAAARTLPSAGGPRVPVRRRRWRSVLAVALPALVAAVVAVAALGLFAHQHPAPAPASRSPRAQLLQSVAVLRLPQVPADRDSELIKMYAFPITIRARPRWGYPRLDTGLLRIVRIASLHARVLIAPTTYQPSATSRRRVEGVNLAVQSPTNDMIGSGPRPTSVASFEAHGVGVGFGMGGGGSPVVLLVPDGVARVVIGSPRGSSTANSFPANRPTLRFQAPAGLRDTALRRAIARLTGSATVHQNLAAFRFAVPSLASSGLVTGFFAVHTRAPATWYAADGSVIRHTIAELDLLIRVAGRKR